MMIRSLALALCALAVVACKKNNSEYCDATTPCSGGRACDTLAHQCSSSHGHGTVGDMGSGVFSCSQCTGATPLCTPAQTSCAACTTSSTPNAACAAVTPAAPLCLTSGSGAGACVACLGNADCATNPAAAICDATAHDCRPCQADAECASGVCDLVESSVTHGRCVDASQVVYVDGSTTNPGNGLTAAMPLAAILDGIDTASNAPRPYVHIAPGTYAEVLSIVGRSVFLVADPGTVIIKPNGSHDGFDVSGNSTLGMRGLVVSAPGIGISCQGAGATSIVNAYSTQFLSNGNDGIDSNSCTLTLDGCWINGNVGVGVRVAGSFTIINTIISHNSQGGFSQSSAGSVMTFANNTVADNNAGIYAGMYCVAMGSFPIINSIVYDNKAAAGNISDFDASCGNYINLATDDPAVADIATVDLRNQSPGFAATVTVPPTADYYELAAGSVCLDQGTMSGAPDHDYLGLPRPDARTKKWDLGAFERQ